MKMARSPDGSLVNLEEIQLIARSDLGESLVVMRGGASLRIAHDQETVARALGIEITEPETT